jgi:deazaflavin-dependent oxidoreductase (nitroreductase family)
MADTTAPVRRPSPQVMRLYNNLPKLILRSPLHGIMSKKVLLLSFTGRKSGKRYTLPLSYVQTGDTLWLGTQTPWWKNLHGGAPVTARVQGKTVTGIADVITDEAGMREAYHTILTLYPGYGRFINVSLEADGYPSVEAVADARRRGLVVIRVKLDRPTA